MSAPGASNALDALAFRLGSILSQRQWKVTTAESCTGGGVARAITEVAGSSGWFEGGWVVYSNRVKRDWLGIDAALLARCGAVSEPVVRALAVNARLRANAQLSVAVSGIAGPDGAVPGRPVGTVWFGWDGQDVETVAECRHFSGDRAAVREQSTAHALAGLLRQLTA